jgi:hypothetical protein
MNIDLREVLKVRIPVIGQNILFALLFSSLGRTAAFAESAASGWTGTPTAAHPYFAEGKAISGTVQLSPDLIDRGYAKKDFQFTDADVLFVIARKGSGMDSPPVAVVRIPNLKDKKFPLKFQIGPDDIMMAGEGQFVGPFNLKAKLSRQGSATTAPGDLIGYSKNTEIKMGSADILIDLTEIGGASEAGATGGIPAVQPATANVAATPAMANSVAANPHSSGKAVAVATAAVTGEISLSPALAEKLKLGKFAFADGDALFVVAKDVNSKENKPLAVTRIVGLTGRQFPISFTLSQSDVMGAGEITGSMLLKAKLSRQGGVQTQKGDLSCEYAEGKGVKLGEKGVKIVLTSLAE